MAKKTITKKKPLLSSPRNSFLFILLLSFILYGNTIFNKYALDDEFVIKNNSLVMKGIKGIPEIVTTQYFTGKQATFGYRPVTKVVFAIEFEIFGSNPKASHFINILLYALTGFLLFRLLNKILGKKTGSVFIWIVTVIWLAHPVHTEVVASLKNREELLCMIFSLLTLKFIITYVENKRTLYLISALILFALAFLTKQSAVSFVLLIPFILWYMFVKPEPVFLQAKNNFRIIFSVALLAFVAYVSYKLPSLFLPSDEIDLLSFENPLRFEDSKIARLALAAYTLLIDLKLMLFPHPLVFYYGQFTIPEVKIYDISVLASLLLHAVLTAYIAGYIKQKGIFLFGLVFYYLTILPFSNYFIEINGIVGERFLFVPSAGFIVSFVYMIFFFTKNNVSTSNFNTLTKSLRIFVYVVLAVFTVKTIARNTSWKDSETLYLNDIAYLDKSVKANDILAQEIMDKLVADKIPKPLYLIKPRIDSIIFYYSRSLSLYPENPKAMNNIAHIYLNYYKQPDSALTYLHRAYKLKNTSFEVAYNLAHCYEVTGRDTLATEWYSKATRLNPQYYLAWQNLINLFFRTGMNDSALFTCQRMLKTDTTTEIPYTGIGYYHLIKSDTAEAVKWWEKAFIRNPMNSERAFSLAKYFHSRKDTLKANYYYTKASEAKKSGR